MIKKIFCICLSLCIAIYGVNTVYGVTDAVPQSDKWAKLPCEAAILIEAHTGKLLMEKNADAPFAPASITKVMTLLLIMEEIENGNLKYTDMVITSPEAKIMGGSEIWLEVGEEMSVEHMLKAIAVASANDAAVAMAEHISGSEQSFVDKMNKRANELGLKNTHFKNSHGLDEDGHYTSARDVAIITKELLKHDRITEFSSIWMDTLRNGETELVNTNKLIRFYKGATGLKTGTTDNAGHSLVATAERNGLSLIGVTLKSPTGAVRFDCAREILDYGFANYQSIPVPNATNDLPPVTVLGGKLPSVLGECNPPKALVMPKSGKSTVTTKINQIENLEAPVEKGQLMGNVEILLDGNIVCVYDITAANSVLKMNIPDCFIALWQNTISMG